MSQKTQGLLLMAAGSLMVATAMSLSGFTPVQIASTLIAGTALACLIPNRKA